MFISLRLSPRLAGFPCILQKTMELWTQTSLVRAPSLAVKCCHCTALWLLCADLDPNTAITSVGVSQFVMCADSVTRPIILLTIPADHVVFHACETSRDVAVLTVTCQPVGAAALGPGAPRTRAAFAVQLKHTEGAAATQAVLDTAVSAAVGGGE